MPQAISDFLQSKYFRLTAYLVLISFLAYFTLQLFIYHYQVITYPFPMEYREGTILVTTDMLLKGENPYALVNQPQATNIYGIFYNLLLVPLVKLFSHTLLVHRLVSGFFVLASCGLMYHCLRFLKVSHLFTIPAVVLFYLFLLFPSTTTALPGPHSLGEFLFLGSIFIPFWSNYSKKSLMISLILGLCAFYSKTYFFVGIIFLSFYLVLFVSKKKGLLYGLSAIFLIVGSGLIVTRFMDCYFNNTLMINYNFAGDSLPHARFQVGEFFTQLREITFFALLILIIQGIMFFKNLPKSSVNQTLSKPRLLNLFSFNQPLVNRPMDLIFFYFLLTTLLIYFKLGRHGGSWMAYLFHLMTPFFLILTFRYIDRLKNIKLLFIPIIIANCFHLWTYFEKVDFKVYWDHWTQVKELIGPCHNILNSPAIVPFLVEENKPVYDSGQSEIFKVGGYRPGILRQLLVPGRPYVLRHYQFLGEIRDKIEKKEFDLLVLTKDYAPFAPGEITQFYNYIGTIHVVMPHPRQNWFLTFWRPK